MCGPPALALAAAAVSAAGTIQGGLAANAQGKFAARVAERNAALANDQIRDARERGALEARSLYRRYSQLQGQQRAAMAANGIDVDFGSAALAQEDTRMLMREDAAALYRNFENEAKGYEINAANYRSQAQAERMRGKNAMIGSFFQAGGTLLEGASQFGRVSQQVGQPAGAWGISGSGGLY